jgi:hypothetical protein
MKKKIDFDVKELINYLPGCTKADFIDFKTFKITFSQFKALTLKAVSLRNGFPANFVILDDMKE